MKGEERKEFSDELGCAVTKLSGVPVEIKTSISLGAGPLPSRSVSIFLATFPTELQAETEGEEAFKRAPWRKLRAT